jgi:hypothetical protein
MALAVVGLVIGVRTASAHHTSTAVHPAKLQAGAAPSNPAIEQSWGIRFTNVVLLSDGGMVELRYTVVNPATSGRIHSGGQNAANLPNVVNERTGSRIKPSSAMLHFHHGNQTSDGRAYSIIYGNAGNTVQAGDTVTIEMSDHQQLRHVPVTN